MLRTEHATLADAPALAALWNATYPDKVTQEDSFHKRLQQDPSQTGYFLTRAEERVAGAARYNLSRREGDPAGKYWVYLTLGKTDDESAVVESLYRTLIETLTTLGAKSFYTMTHETKGGQRESLESLGFAEILRSYGADLDVASVNLEAHGDVEVRLNAQGIAIRTRAELTDDPAHVAKLHALYLETNRDVPEVGHADTMTLPEFEQHLSREDALPDAYFVATQGDDYVGYTEMFAEGLHAAKPHTLQQETTAVKRSHRRLGIALALKLRGVAYARRHGIRSINTGMASNNVPMVTLNTRLGFVAQPAWITLRKEA